MKTRLLLIDEIQIIHQGIWGHVAGENWTLQNAQVVCRQLNKPGVKRFRLVKTKATSQPQMLWLKGVHCKGNETKLIDCPKRHWLQLKKESVSEWKASVECNNGNIFMYYNHLRFCSTEQNSRDSNVEGFLLMEIMSDEIFLQTFAALELQGRCMV